MASILKTGKGWRVWLTVKGQRDSRMFQSYRDAQLWAAQRTIELEAELSGRAGQFKTVQDALTRYADEVSPTHKGHRWEVIRLARISGELPRITLDRFTQSHIADWRDHRLESVKGSSVLREMKLLGAVFEHARKEWRWISVNPVSSVKKPRAPPHRRRIITWSETRKMLRALGYPGTDMARQRVGWALVLALRTGMRAGELCSITWGMVHSVFVRLPPDGTKNGLGRDVPLSARARHTLARLKALRPADSILGLRPGTLDTMFREARQSAGLDGFTFHDARHTAATRIVRSGRIDVLTLCKMFGWSDPKQAMVYFNPSAEEIAARL